MSTLEFNEALTGLETNLKAFAMGYTRNSDDACDLTQETMLKAMTYRHQYAPHTNFKAWVFTIMRNIFINQYRRSQKSGMIFDRSETAFLLVGAVSDSYSTEHYLAGKDIRMQLGKLVDDVRKPFELHFHGYKYHEIAETLNIPIGTVKSRIFAARKKLMELLPDYA